MCNREMATSYFREKNVAAFQGSLKMPRKAFFRCSFVNVLLRAPLGAVLGAVFQNQPLWPRNQPLATKTALFIHKVHKIRGH